MVLAFNLLVINCSGQDLKSGKIIIDYRHYFNQQVILQGGIFPDSFGYNDFYFYDSTSTFMKSVKMLKSGKLHNNIGIIARYTHPFQFSYFDTATQSGYNSSFFFVGRNTISVRIKDFSISSNVLAGKMSKDNKEYSHLQNLYKKIDNQSISKAEKIVGKLEVSKRYVLKKSNSYVALWDLAIFYPTLREGTHKRIVLGIIQNFSEEIKASKTYLALENNIAHDLELEKGNNFPNDIIGESGAVLEIASRNKFTLVDFWFSGCVPCLNQFDTLSKIYKEQKGRNFEIIGISTDSEQLIQRWQAVIDKFKINWINYLDTNGIQTKKLFIRKFPTNFLIDKNGKILEKDISPAELDAYLKENL